ncbi:AAEL014021-PA [Aedes aegypti]|uniref:Mediator of RNA polymerase II transcription subunit 23 n=1 Tax=Aedes aegypti TaxID=7159 RepID=MED23_AEDAE|nr:mediator of RNA polymerase II transcription subunit 23 [Aedes aegypti]Q16HH9.1 RecName: Full=Mediator of RNA polymerase II transcription subunit 23; AltName: Full=Mediator complex subunit 23 [Aedes aegypti]EAT33704.1 AAEL014021-PA [Aedes aegypti]
MSTDTQIIKLVEEILCEKTNDYDYEGPMPDEAELQKRAEDGMKKFATVFAGMSQEVKENALRSCLIHVAGINHRNKVRKHMQVLKDLVGKGIIPARLLCEQIMSSEKLVYQNQSFWIECFQVVRRVIGGVDYKGVREIMKCCKEKALSFPSGISSSILPQMLELTEVIEHIFNRNACLLPAYFIINEIQKADYQDTHWRIANLIANFIEEFVIVAQMLSIIGHSSMLPIVEHSSYADNLINPWKLDPTTLKLALRGNLPYEPELLQPQIKLLRFVLEQPYSRDMVCSMLNLQKTQKQKCMALEEQLVWLVMCAMECSEKEPVHTVDGEISSHTQWVWLHLSSQLIYFVLFQFATFQNIVNTLHDKLAVSNLRRGRDHLMWVLLQYISGSIQRNSITNFLPILKLYDSLYPEKEPLPVPDYNNPLCTHQMAPTCIWIHLLKRAQSEHYNINRSIPTALKLHHEFLQHLVMPNNNATLCMGSDYRLALLCNAYSTNPDYFSRPMAALIETILGNCKNPSAGGGSTSATQPLPTVPLSMSVLDSLTIHSKMSLIHSIVTHMIKQAQSKTTVPNTNNMAPALVETYSRLLVYTEIESLGIKGFLGQLLPQVFKSAAWGILYTLLEMFSYRMHHIQPHYRVQLLSHLHSLASVPHTNQMQLHSCVESTALRLITGLGSVEVQAQMSRYVTEQKAPGNIVSAESEELNRALILTLARSMQITGTGNDPQSTTWCKELLNSIMQNTPHTWSQHTLQCFPPVLNDLVVQHNVPKENKQLLKKSVDEEYRNWTSMSNENDIIGHFGTAGTPGTPPLFLCLLFKMIVETDTISPVAYKILERIGARALSAHLRKLCDYLVFEVSNSGDGAHVNKCVDTINDMIWKYNIITIDRLVLCLSLRTLEGNEAQVSFCIIQLLLLKTSEFRNRLQEFVSINSPEHWKQNNWHERHLAFHQKFPEKFTPDESVSHPSLPVYFGNVCLRFLPVLDITIHRYLEVPAAMSKTLDVLLDHLGPLYKFHDRPITYLYNTLHYYERMLRDRPQLKKRLVGTVIGSLKDVRPDNWAVTEQYQSYMSKKDDAVNWMPDLNYYIYLVRRMQDTIDGTNIFPGTDWRFNEFPNPPAHALYVTCVELLGLPVGPQGVANSLIDVVVKGYPVIPSQSVHNWINTIGLIMAALPESYWGVIYERLREVISCPQMTDWLHRQSPFELFNFKIVREAMLEKNYVVILAIAQSILHHSGIGQISTVTEHIKENFKPIIKTEYQLIYLCHLVGPFLNRLCAERSRAVSDITLILYELLEQVDKAQPSLALKYMDPICDLLYHIKYMFIGDMMKSDLEAIIRRLRPALQMRLRFITRLNVDEIGVDQQNVDASAAGQGPAQGGPQSQQPQTTGQAGGQPSVPQQQQQTQQQQPQQQQQVQQQ